MADPVYKKIADLTSSSDVQDSDQAEIQRGIAGYSVTFLTVWNWIKTKISNWSTVLQYLGDSSGKLTYKGSVIDKGAAGTSGQIQANISGIVVIGNVSFEIGDQVWADVKNDSTARNYTVIRSTMHVR